MRVRRNAQRGMRATPAVFQYTEYFVAQSQKDRNDWLPIHQITNSHNHEISENFGWGTPPHPASSEHIDNPAGMTASYSAAHLSLFSRDTGTSSH